jgi:hypothetical protein
MIQDKIQIEEPTTIKIQFQHPLPKMFQIQKDDQPYYFRHLDGKTSVINVNFPEHGTYTTDTPFHVIQRTSLELYDTSRIKLPKPDRNYPIDNIKVERNTRGDMGTTPARIFPKLQIIETSPEFWKYPAPIRFFILCHELGHMRYDSEVNADMFALKMYLNAGYNGSMAFYALSHVLKTSKANIVRLKKVFSHLMNYDK